VNTTPEVFQMRLKFPDGAEFIIHTPLRRTPEERALMRELMEKYLESWDRAYDPRPCERCCGSGDERDARPS